MVSRDRTLMDIDAILESTLGPEGAPYRFRMGLRPGTGNWFEVPELVSPDAVLEVRRRWQMAEPDRALPWSAGADEFMPEFLGLLSGPGGREVAGDSQEGRWGGGRGAAKELGGRWKTDFLLLAEDGGSFRFVGGCVCFPTAWAPEEKLGRTVGEIHAPVPTLNATMGERISEFLHRLGPGEVFERFNWGMAAVPDLNLHPWLGRPRLAETTTLEEAWFRVEHQAFARLSRTRGIAFLIRIHVFGMQELRSRPPMARRLAAQLESMPDAIAEYKGLSKVRARWTGALRG